jgi:hypothetical protein
MSTCEGGGRGGVHVHLSIRIDQRLQTSQAMTAVTATASEHFKTGMLGKSYLSETCA